MTKQGSKHPNWKGGRYIDSRGYVSVRVDVNQYKREHRLVMEQILGRPIGPGEIIHHINGNKQDNRPENLVLTTNSKHTNQHWKDGNLESFGREQRPQAKCHPDRPHYAKGLCRKCYMREAQKRYFQKHPEKRKAAKKAYREKYKEKINARKRELRALARQT